METFKIDDLYFTAPTFITRLDGNDSWSPEGSNDNNLMTITSTLII